MESSDIFTNVLLTDKIKVRPEHIGSNLPSILHAILVRKYEDKCSHHGYIKRKSIRIYKYSVGQVISASLNGDVSFVIQYFADVCNPIIESVVAAQVVNTNKFGILAECSIKTVNGTQPVLEIIIAKNTHSVESEVDLSFIKNGDMVFVEILGKKFELNDKKISVVGRIVKDTSMVTKKTKQQVSAISLKDDEDEVDEVHPEETSDDDGVDGSESEKENDDEADEVDEVGSEEIDEDAETEDENEVSDIDDVDADDDVESVASSSIDGDE